MKMFHVCPSHSDGTGRTGTYILIDMVLNRMAKGKCVCVSHTHAHFFFSSRTDKCMLYIAITHNMITWTAEGAAVTFLVFSNYNK